MTEEDIKNLAKKLGLNPELLKIREPFWHKILDARQYRLEYKMPTKVIDWNFLITRLDIDSGAENELIGLYVNLGLRKLRELATARGGR